MKIVKGETVFPSAPGTDRQNCAFPQVAVLPGGRRAADGGNADGGYCTIPFADVVGLAHYCRDIAATCGIDRPNAPVAQYGGREQ